MPDLTNSYCERCGARYDFAPNAPKGLSLRGARVLAKGLKNFVLTDSQSMSDAMALARHDDEHQDSSRMTEAFHRTFNFCMTCRQYACDKCWNERVGACLSCSPEPDSEVLPLDDHMLVRTPVASWDTDWSAFAEDLAAESAQPAAQPTRFDAPIHLEEATRAVPPAWPVIDLPDGAPGAAGGPNPKSGRRGARKAVDPVAASLWPLADEIAPEMTLTPEELEIVESSLGQGETLQDSAHATEIGPEPEWLTAMPAPWMPQPVDGAVIPVLQPGVQPQRILSMPMASLPPLAPPTPAPQIHGHIPVVGRLLGRHAPQIGAPSPEQPRLGPTGQGESAGDAWPQATKWVERPAGLHDRLLEPEVPAAALAMEPGVEPTPTPAPVQPAAAPGRPTPAPELAPPPAAAPALPSLPEAVAPAPMLPRTQWAQVDARIAAAVRLSGVSVGPTESNPTDIDVAPDMASLWAAPEPRQGTDSEAVEVRHGQSAGTQERAPGRPVPAGPQELVEQAEPSAEPPAPWPPLGASWPAQEAPGTPWPAPPSPPVAAIVATQRVAAQTLDEMWTQSAQQVLNRGSVRVCHRCALPVSTQARFCRRCGTKQA
jgi:ribosomal protein L40E